MTEPKGEWLRKPESATAVIFVHGVLSSGDTCWRSSESYWPSLLLAEPRLSHIGIYLFSYRSDAFSAGYSLGDAVEALNAYLNLDQLLQLQRLAFICHSMGGILVRQLLVTRQTILLERKVVIGLFLVASPSLGSDYANYLQYLARAVGNSQAEALRFADNNVWLRDLDRNFINLKESHRLPIVGRELVEDEFFAFPSIIRKQVVRPFSGARYFGDALKIPGSNHFTIAKPAGKDALQHRVLVSFIEEFEHMSMNDRGVEMERPASQGIRPVADVQPSTQLSLAELRQYLVSRFSDEEIDTLCHDFFLPVFEQFTTGMSKNQKIHRLIDYARRREQLPVLLSLIAQEDPGGARDLLS